MSTPSPRYRGVLMAVIPLVLLLGLANLIMGDLNQDEGWYLYAAQQVADGLLPYRDFAYTQGPMLPLVYALFSPVIDTFGVGGGRAVTWVFGLLAAVLAYVMARNLGGSAAGVLAFILAGLNVYQSYFTTVVKTYSLCALFMVFGLFAVSRWVVVRKSGWLVLAGMGLAAAAGTRLSSGILLPLVGCWLLFNPARWGKLSWLWFGLGGGLTLLGIFLPLYVAAPDGIHFGLIEYHTMRDAGGLITSLVLKAGFISRLIQAYFVVTILVAVMVAVKVLRPFKGNDTGYHQSDAFAFVRLLWMSVAAVTLVHICAPFPYDDYQVPVFPVLAVALAVSWSYAIRAWSGDWYRWQAGVAPTDPGLMRWFLWCVMLVSVAASFSSPVNQDWMIAGRDRIWWKMKTKPSLLLLREIGRDIKAGSKGDVVLTQDTYIAVEAGLRVPLGWEMGPFSYYPDMSDERAGVLNLVNHKKILADIASSTADVAAVSGYGLSIASPAVLPLDDERKAELEAALAARFEQTSEVPMFGQANTMLRIFHRRDNSGSAP